MMTGIVYLSFHQGGGEQKLFQTFITTNNFGALMYGSHHTRTLKEPLFKKLTIKLPTLR